MDINKNEIDRITALDDSVFKEKLENALNAAGAADQVKEKLTQNISQLKKTLGALSQSDLEMLSKKLDEATLNAVKDSLNR